MRLFKLPENCQIKVKHQLIFNKLMQQRKRVLGRKHKELDDISIETDIIATKKVKVTQCLFAIRTIGYGIKMVLKTCSPH